MAISAPCYATREQVKQALDILEVARNDPQVDRAIEAGSRIAEGTLRRVFYPQTATRYFDWPDRQGGVSWRIWLDAAEVVTVGSIVSGGATLAPGDYLLEPVNYGPPFDRIETNLGTNSGFNSGDTHQRAVAVTGTFGYSDTWDAAGVTVEALDATETVVDVDAGAAAGLGVGSLLRVDDEVMLVVDRRQLDTAVTLGGGLTASQANVTVPAGAAFAVGETILIDSERMHVVDVAGTNLTVIRSYDGTVLAVHTTGAVIYGSRSLVVARGVLGSSAATHSTGASVSVWRVPALLRQYTLAEALGSLMQEVIGYAPGRSGSLATSIEYRELGLNGVKERAVAALGRKARTRSV